MSSLFCNFFHVTLWMHLTFFFLFILPLCFFSALVLFCFTLSCFIFLPLFLLSCFFSASAPPTLPLPSAHVDMSTVAFDVDPLDLDAEEPPESQGDPRSSKGMSGSVTSPQANIHRLPFFKKVTLGAQDLLLSSSILHLSLWDMLRCNLFLSLTAHKWNWPCCCCSS